MTFDDSVLMAYVDGELGPIERARIERSMIADPALADRVVAITAFGDRMRAAFVPIVQAPVPGRLAAMLADNVVPIAPARTRPQWQAGLALAASLVLGVVLGTQLAGTAQQPIVVRNGTLVAAGPIAHALDTQLAAAQGDVGIVVSFRSAAGYCRLFASAAVDGLACRDGDDWRIRQTLPGRGRAGADYRTAGSADGALMATAQNMMEGAPLDAAGERRARATGWR